MLFEAVDLVEPRPKPPSMLTRRALLIAGGAFALGMTVGGACGFAAGSNREDAATTAPKLPPPSGNAELDELRRLALVAPIEELVGKHLAFVDSYATSYRDDPYLPHGIDRLISAILDDPDLPDRELMARVVRDAVDRSDSAHADFLVPRVKELEPLFK